jgi:hypothetical protein
MSHLLSKQSLFKINDGEIRMRKNRISNLQVTTTDPFKRPTSPPSGGGGDTPSPSEDVLLNVGGDDLLIDNEGNFIQVS